MQKTLLSLVAITLLCSAETTEIKQLKTRVDLLEKALKTQKDQALKEKINSAMGSIGSFTQTDFVPDIAFIANMSVLGRNVGNAEYAGYQIPGFTSKPSDQPFNPKRGFNLNYGELEIQSTVDPYFDVNSALHIEKDGLHIGELYVTTRALPYGLRLKTGKFKSEFGRINSQHQHTWNFSNIPLVFESFFGAGGLGDEGIQLQYTAPTDTYIQAGFEAMQGSNGRSFGDTDKNNLTIGYLKSSIDIGDMTTLLGGTSWLHGKSTVGESDIYGGDFTLKQIFDSYSSLTWQSELLYRDKETLGDNQKQAGLYSEIVYTHDKNWATGVRYDTLFKNIDNQPDDLNRYTAMLEYRPFVFSKIRLQYTNDRSKMIGGKRKDTHEILLGLTIAAGAHGAHAF